MKCHATFLFQKAFHKVELYVKHFTVILYFSQRLRQCCSWIFIHWLAMVLQPEPFRATCNAMDRNSVIKLQNRLQETLSEVKTLFHNQYRVKGPRQKGSVFVEAFVAIYFPCVRRVVTSVTNRDYSMENCRKCARIIHELRSTSENEYVCVADE